MLGGGNTAWTLRHKPCPHGIFGLATGSAKGGLVIVARQHGAGSGGSKGSEGYFRQRRQAQREPGDFH